MRARCMSKAPPMSRLIAARGARLVESPAARFGAIRQRPTDGTGGPGGLRRRTFHSLLDDEIRMPKTQRAHGIFPARCARQSADAVSPRDPRVCRRNMGKVLAQQGRSAEAVQFLPRAVELQPSDWRSIGARRRLRSIGRCRGGPHGLRSRSRAQTRRSRRAEQLRHVAHAGRRSRSGAPFDDRGCRPPVSHDPQIARNLGLLQGSTPRPCRRLQEPSPIAQQARFPHRGHNQAAAGGVRTRGGPRAQAAFASTARGKPRYKAAERAADRHDAGSTLRSQGRTGLQKVSWRNTRRANRPPNWRPNSGDAPKLRKTVTPVTRTKFRALRMAADRS